MPRRLPWVTVTVTVTEFFFRLPTTGSAGAYELPVMQEPVMQDEAGHVEALRQRVAAHDLPLEPESLRRAIEARIRAALPDLQVCACGARFATSKSKR